MFAESPAEIALFPQPDALWIKEGIQLRPRKLRPSCQASPSWENPVGISGSVVLIGSLKRGLWPPSLPISQRRLVVYNVWKGRKD